MRRFTIRNAVITTGVVGGLWCLAQSSYGATTFHDLTQGGSVTINDAIFRTTIDQPTGTGVFDPFVRLQSQGSHKYEAGYNTSLGSPLDDLANSWHKDIALSSLTKVTFNNKDYYEFSLDLAEPSGGTKPLVTLNQVEIFGNANPAPATGVGMDSTTGRATNPGLLGSLIYDMNKNGGTDAVKLSYDFNGGGNGKDDMQLLVPVSAFGNLKYVVFYSQFGKDPISDGYAAEGSFEEWSALSSPVPEPTTVIAGALLLLPFGASTLKMMRRSKNA